MKIDKITIFAVLFAFALAGTLYVGYTYPLPYGPFEILTSKGIEATWDDNGVTVRRTFGTIQAAIDATPSSKWEIYVPPAKYTISSTISISNKDNWELYGEGWSTVLFLASGTNDNLIKISGCNNFSIGSMYLDGNSPGNWQGFGTLVFNRHGILVESSTYGEIHDVYAEDFMIYGVSIGGWDITTKCSHVTMRNVWAENCTNGIEFEYSTYCVGYDLHATNCSDVGISMWNNNYTTIDGFRTWSNRHDFSHWAEYYSRASTHIGINAEYRSTGNIFANGFVEDNDCGFTETSVDVGDGAGNTTMSNVHFVGNGVDSSTFALALQGYPGRFSNIFINDTTGRAISFEADGYDVGPVWIKTTSYRAVNVASGADYNRLHDFVIEDAGSNAINVNGFYTSISDGRIDGTADYAIQLSSNSDGSTVENVDLFNVVNGAVFTLSGADRVRWSDGYVDGTGATFGGLWQGAYGQIDGVRITGAATGLRIDGSYCSVVGLRAWTVTTAVQFWGGDYGLLSDSYLEGSTTCLTFGSTALYNTVRGVTCNTGGTGISIASGCNDNKFWVNDLTGATTKITDSGTDTIFQNNIEYAGAQIRVTYNSGRYIRYHNTIQGAIDWLPSSGGEVYVPPGTYTSAGIDFVVPDIVLSLSADVTLTISGPIKLNNTCVLEGAGIFATKIVLANGADCNMIEAVDCWGWVIRDLTLDGNKANQASGRGVYVYRSTGMSNPPYWDYLSRMEDVFIWQAKDDGIYGDGDVDFMAPHFARVNVYECGKTGITWKASDPIFSDCTAGNNDQIGIRVACTSGMFVNCKSFGSGQSGNYPNWKIEGSENVLINPIAEDGQGDGIWVTGTSDNLIVAPHCRRNDQGGYTSAGIKVDGTVSHLKITGGHSFDDQGTPTQDYGLELSGTLTDCVFSGITFYGNVVSSITDSSTNARIENNPGYNPVGAITNAWDTTGNTVRDSGGVAASPTTATTYTCWQSPKDIYFTGGTITDVKVNGQTVFTDTGHMIHVESGETCQFTYTGTPTWVVIAE